MLRLNKRIGGVHMDQDTLLLKDKLLAEYDASFDKNGVSGKRMAERLDALSKIGRTSSKGSNRPGFSHEEKAAKELVMQWMAEAGLDAKMDGAGNVFGRLAGKKADAPAILSGSHVDSVPNGGHFDGPLGVLAALEVAEAWKATNYRPEKPYEVVIFSDEEGSRFQEGLSGSEAMMGKVDRQAKIKRRDTAGVLFADVLADVDLSVEGYFAAKRDLNKIAGFVEVHIEQGKRLEKAGLPCGIVTGIAGPHWLYLTFEGEAGHAGNTPMDDRRDALVAASAFIVACSELPRQINTTSVVTVGKLFVEPNGVNVIPGKVSLYVDVRDIHLDTRDELVQRVLEISRDISEKYGVKVTHEDLLITPPVPVSEEQQEKMKQALEANQIDPYYLPSGAGHDSQIVGSHLPMAMLFVQSKDGISHNPAEWTDLNHCVQAVHVLKTYLESIQDD